MQDANSQPVPASSGRSAPSFIFGLEALSLEAPTQQQRRSFARLSERLQHGETFEQALAQESSNFPVYLRRLFSAPIASEKWGVLIERYIKNAQRHQDVFRHIVTSLAYPAILVAFTCGIIYFLLSLAVAPFKKIFEDFGTELPPMTQTLIWLSDIAMARQSVLFIALIAILAIIAWYLPLLIAGASGRRYLMNSIPAFGTVLRYGSLAQFCDLLALLVEFNVPLPEALRLASEGADDSSLQSAGEELAVAAENGVPLADAVLNLPEFPPLATHVFRWEKRQEAFADGLEAIADVFAARSHLQSGLLRVVLEPFILAFIGVTIGFVVLALFLPLIKLLNDLS